MAWPKSKDGKPERAVRQNTGISHPRKICIIYYYIIAWTLQLHVPVTNPRPPLPAVVSSSRTKMLQRRQRWPRPGARSPVHHWSLTGDAPGSGGRAFLFWPSLGSAIDTWRDQGNMMRDALSVIYGCFRICPILEAQSRSSRVIANG